jgi:hypothetical protein
MKTDIKKGISIIVLLIVGSFLVYFGYKEVQRTKRLVSLINESNEKFEQIEKERQQREFEYLVEEKEYVTVKNLDDIEVVAKVELADKTIIEFRMSPKVCDYDLISQQIILSKVKIYYLLLDHARIPKNSTVVSLCIEKCK